MGSLGQDALLSSPGVPGDSWDPVPGLPAPGFLRIPSQFGPGLKVLDLV